MAGAFSRLVRTVAVAKLIAWFVIALRPSAAGCDDGRRHVVSDRYLPTNF